MKTQTTIWNAENHRFTLVYSEESTLLLVDDEVLLSGGTAVFEPLVRALKRRLVRSPPNAGKPWSAEDDATLTQHHGAGDDTSQLTGAFGRTRGAIEARLVRLGLVEAGPAQRWPNGQRASSGS